MRRDGRQCVLCGDVYRLEVDHVIPEAKGGARWDPGNLQTLCRKCHIAKTREEWLARREPKTPGRADWIAACDDLERRDRIQHRETESSL